MMNAGIARALEVVEQRSDDLRLIYQGGALPNFDDAVRGERAELTGDPLSLVLPPDAFLLAGDSQKPTYTRDGALAVRDGVLVDGSGAPVLGFRDGDTTGIPQPLQVEKNDALLGRASDVRVEPDGVFGYARSVLDPKTQTSSVERVVVGRLALARFPAGTRLERVDATHAKPPAGVIPLVGTPNDGSFLSVEVQRRAVGHMDSDAAIVRLQEAYLTMRALSAEERTRNAFARGAFDLVK